MKLTVVVPCYNEKDNIPLILKRFSETIGKRNIEVILINNGSTDDSQNIIDELLPNYSFARSVFVPVNKGYGYGILQGLKAADGDFIGWTHADMQTDPNDISRAYDIIRERKTKRIYVKGKRKGRPPFDVLFTAGMSGFESVLFGTKLNDINGQPNIFPIELFRKLENPPFDFSLDLYIYYMAKRFRLEIVRFPVDFTERIHGQSKWNTDGLKSKIKFIKRTLSYSIKLKKDMMKK